MNRSSVGWGGVGRWRVGSGVTWVEAFPMQPPHPQTEGREEELERREAERRRRRVGGGGLGGEMAEMKKKKKKKGKQGTQRGQKAGPQSIKGC